jgi:catechol 2,3-dioxygenase-like lactoylglutathione lyase family enzyme
MGEFLSMSQPISELDSLHHIALAAPNIKSAVEWYTKNFNCRIKYQDETWALLAFANMDVALVIPEQHPPHIAFGSPEAEKFGELKPHRDGTRSCYVRDPAGNSIEIMKT